MNTRDLIDEAIADHQRQWEEMAKERRRRRRVDDLKHLAILGACSVAVVVGAWVGCKVLS